MSDDNVRTYILAHIKYVFAVELTDDLSRLIDTSIVRIFRKKSLNMDFITSSSGTQAQQLLHIVDWLRASLANAEPWLQNLDSLGRPKKLMKFGSLEQMAKEADKAMLKFSQKTRKTLLSDLDEEIFADLEDGFYVVKLKSPTALDVESNHMQHCIGAGSYDDKLQHQGCLYLSLRDEAGKPHATIEVRDGHIMQLQGKQNSKPIQKYLDVLMPFLQEQKWQFTDVPRYYDYLIDKDGSWHSLCSLPDGLHISTDVMLSIHGDKRHLLNNLPKNMTVDGSLYLVCSHLCELPSGLKVGKTLSIRGTPIKVIPDGTKVGWLIHDSFMLRKIGRNVSIQGDLAIAHTAVSELGDGLFVGGSLDMTSSKVIELPENLTVIGGLKANGYKLPSLPKGLSVLGYFNLSDSLVEAIPEDIKVGSLDLRNSKVKSLPDGLNVPGTLDISWTKIESLPSRLSVGSMLAIEETSISSLPADLELGGALSISRENIGQIPLDIISNYRLIVDGRHMTVEDFNDEKAQESKVQRSKVSVALNVLVER